MDNHLLWYSPLLQVVFLFFLQFIYLCLFLFGANSHLNTFGIANKLYNLILLNASSYTQM